MEAVLSVLAFTFIGFPGIILSLGLSVIGLLEKKATLVVIGATLAIPFSCYLGFGSGFFFFGFFFFLPLFQLGEAFAIHRHLAWLAWLLLLPFATILGWIFVQN